MIGKPIQGRRAHYPSRLFSLADYYTPSNIKDIFSWCLRLALTNEIVSSAMHKLAEAPITDLVYEHANDGVKERYKLLFEHNLRIRERLLEVLFDLVVYSNAMVSFEVPVTRFLISPALHEDAPSKMQALQAGKMPGHAFDGWLKEVAGEPGNPYLPSRFRAHAIDWSLDGKNRFTGQCPVTDRPVIFERLDRHYATANNISIKRWDPNRIEIEHNEITGKNKYFYNMTNKTRRLIKMKDRDMFNEVDWQFIAAAFANRNVRIIEENFYHLANVRLSGAFPGWGVPRLFSAFKMIFYYLTLLRANEATAIGKIHDLNILFPAYQGTSGMEPAGVVGGPSFVANVQTILRNHQRDPNYTGISPMPIGVTSIFGQGRMQLISGELEPIVRSIATALGLPYDLLFGGGAYTGQAVAQRIFTAQTGLHRERFNEFMDFLVGRTSSALSRTRYPDDLTIRLKPEEGPDAVQIKSLIVDMGRQGDVSRETMLKQVGLDWNSERDRLEEEAKQLFAIKRLLAKGDAHAQVEGQSILQRAQQRMMEEQAALGMPGMMDPAMMDPAMMDPAMNPAINPAMMAGLESMEQGGPVDPAMPYEPEREGQAYEQAQILYQYALENPGSENAILEVAAREYPAAMPLLSQLLSGGVPTAEAPMLDAPYADEGVPPRRALPPQQSEMLPPRRAVGGL